MTTDTVPKAASLRLQLGGRTVTVTGISKGAGMIHPEHGDDARLRRHRRRGRPGADAAPRPGSRRRVVQSHHDRRRHLDQRFVRSHRHPPRRQRAGARPRRAATAGSCAMRCSKSRAGSPRRSSATAKARRSSSRCASKAAPTSPSAGKSRSRSATRRWSRPRSSRAIPNLGRILAAVGYAGIADLDQTRIDLFLDDVHVVEGGGRRPSYREEDGQRVMKQSEITVRVDLHRGPPATTVWTCDLSYDYVKINADYRS